MRIFDTHSHYDDKAFDEDRDALITEMLSKNVAGFMAIGCGGKSNEKALLLASLYKNVWATVGVHPGSVHDYDEDIVKYLGDDNIKAIGEIGLDYFDGCDKKKQTELFIRQIIIAKEHDLPIVIHSRDATEDIIKIIKQYRPKAVMHCFSGSAETAKQLIKLDVMISFTGVLTFKNARKAVDACKVIPTDMIMLETDCPYMAPTPFRGKRCNSSMTIETAKKAAEIKGLELEELVTICNNNAKRFFSIEFD